VKTLSSSWMSDGGVFGVVPSLEASSLENQLDFGIAALSVMIGFNRRWQVCCVVSWMGVADSMRRRLRLWWRSEVVACLLVVAACSGPRRLVLLGNAWQWSVQRGTTLEDVACGISIGIGIVGRLGLQRTVAGRSARLGYPVRDIIERWRKRLLWFTNMAAEVSRAGEA
jgi:hypothetical protein